MNTGNFKVAMFIIIFAKLICSLTYTWTSNNKTFLVYTLSFQCSDLKDLSVLNLPSFTSIEEKVVLASKISS